MTFAPVLAASWVGSAPGWVLVAMGLFVAWRVSRGGGGAALAELERANKILEDSLHRLHTEVTRLEAENAALRVSTNYETALSQGLKPLTEWMHGHESRAQERHTESMSSLKRSTDAMVGAIEQVGHVVGRELANGRE